ncbi:hypothetical protein [Streptomyces sp. DSM 40907]|uniref:hypothetical protein n=1 Tax=Streptomyces kutzneri TaxID=3051179 RepID=UPI0028D7D4A9|nr:hypothetical protein [Streptomyces sp. DSM 40907]
MPGEPPTNPHVTAAFDNPAPVYHPDSRRWAVLRHSLSIAITTAVIVLAFMVVTLPFVAVFFIDQDFIARDYAKVVLVAAGVGFTTSLLIFPVAFGFERLVMRGGRTWKVLAVCAPVAFPVAAALIFVALFKFQPSAAVGDAFGVAILFFMSFSVYWLSLWSLSAVRYGAWRLVQRMGRCRPLGAPGCAGRVGGAG